MQKYLTVERGWAAHDPDVKQLFGLDRKAKWPAEGLHTRSIQGIDCWVRPLRAGRDSTDPGPFRGRGQFKLRAYCRCPVCGDEMPIGRLAQHSKVHKENADTSPEMSLDERAREDRTHGY